MPTDVEILPMGVGDTNFAVFRAARDVRPMAWLRELTQNAMEAVLKTGKPGQVTWRSVQLDHYDAPKLAVEDTGCGMTREEILKYINNLYSSGGQQDLHGNYGVGAKLAGASVSPAGLEYLSFASPSAPGAYAVLVGRPRYGLKKIRTDAGEYCAIVDVPNTTANRFELLRETDSPTGTQVVLVGNDPVDDWSVPAKWRRELAQELTKRYFTVPETVTLRVEWASSASASDSGVNFAHVKGQKAFLDEYAQDRGRIDLTGAAVFWWIMKEDTPKQSHGFGRGHMAALYQNETYDFLQHKTTPSGRRMLAEFGVYVGWQRVVIYVEPKSDAYYPDAPRARLLNQGEDLPWSRWASEFRASMPDAVRRFVEAESAGGKTNNAEQIARYLSELYPDHRLPSYRKGDQEARAGEPKRGPNSGPGRGCGPSGSKGGGTGGGESRSRFFDPGTTEPGEPVDARNFPKVIWVSEATGKRADGELEDLAAEYARGPNVIKVNEDFRGWRTFLEEAVQAADDAAEPVMRELCRFVWELLVTNVVVSANQLRGSPHWTPEQIEEAVSTRALTIAVVDRIARSAVLKNYARVRGIKLDF